MNSVQSLERAIAILKCFGENTQLGITEIGVMTELNKTTAYNLVQTLVKNGFLEQDPASRKYMLGLELFRIGSYCMSGLKDVCLPYMRDLSEQTGETVNLVTRHNNSVVFVEKIESAHSMRICTAVGQQYPLYSSACGKVILAFLDEDERERLIDEMEMKPFTEHTVVDKNELRRNLTEIQRRGYAEDMEEMEYGLVCIAVPILGSNRQPQAALSVSGPLMRMNVENRERVHQCLCAAANSIEQRLS